MFSFVCQHLNIICSTGFYYTEEPVLYNSSAELIAEYIVKDTENINITPRGQGVITIKVYVDEVLKYGPTQLDLNSDNTILEIK